MSTATRKEHKSNRPERGGLVTFVEAIRQGLWEEMERSPEVFLIGEDVGAYGGAFKVTEGIIDHFGPERVIDTPISEAAIVGAACGAALMGMKPVAEFQFIDFISAGFDLLTNYAAKCRYRWGAGLQAVFRGPCGSGVHAGPFHSLNAESFFLNTAGLKIVEPSTAYDAQVLNALDAAAELEKEGLDVEVIDLRTLAPLDKEAILATVQKTSKVLLLH